MTTLLMLRLKKHHQK